MFEWVLKIMTQQTTQGCLNYVGDFAVLGSGKQLGLQPFLPFQNLVLFIAVLQLIAAQRNPLRDVLHGWTKPRSGSKACDQPRPGQSRGTRPDPKRNTP